MSQIAFSNLPVTVVDLVLFPAPGLLICCSCIPIETKFPVDKLKLGKAVTVCVPATEPVFPIPAVDVKVCWGWDVVPAMLIPCICNPWRLMVLLGERRVVKIEPGKMVAVCCWPGNWIVWTAFRFCGCKMKFWKPCWPVTVWAGIVMVCCPEVEALMTGSGCPCWIAYACWTGCTVKLCCCCWGCCCCCCCGRAWMFICCGCCCWIVTVVPEFCWGCWIYHNKNDEWEILLGTVTALKVKTKVQVVLNLTWTKIVNG